MHNYFSLNDACRIYSVAIKIQSSFGKTGKLSHFYLCLFVCFIYFFFFPTLFMLLLILISLYEIFLREILTYAHSSVYPKIYCVARKVFLRYEDFRKHQSHLYEWDFQPCPLVNYDQHFLFPHSHFLHSHLPPQIKQGGQFCVMAFLKLIVKGNVKKNWK